MRKNLNFSEFGKILKENIVLIILCVVIFGAFSFVVSQFIITPKYQATANVIINQKRANDDNLYKNPNEIQTNIQLIKTYSEIISSEEIKNKALEKINTNDENSLYKGLTVDTVENSQIIKINVLSEHPKEAVAYANEVAKTSKEEIERVMGVDNLSILSKATNDQVKSPTTPNISLNVVFGIVFGLVISFLIMFTKYLLNNKIKSEKEVEDYLQLPTIGKISDLGDKK
ncbi:Wzz/FepE/Etk N-terminal domain-containing protein [Staphylococcus sp. NRL 16/872]|uniref:YveK family protein n=1 Tax=Staphylococcus sp. NRL 16/872 TaxID=2930131 RepID=UPI001FB5648C|nr:MULTISPECIES: Wzz/FepE/Etk N-terminal domain-containing protein [unclassified Staphylococcus]MCJ1655228.1 Wzz/FepE/Etk N-terminal domain-containing protein [Staphylococcus sp. NRL 21/187]MCJ1661061.1 Wzz/FepE/Etk N-terminal domain-containing protein [Staphylococcus sp. NRL 18/288]MCJ1666960.1 Wzz/FepE/Etk N-terminal domain-containing protein [Staphylococcus sp. NRL 19/737]WEN69432.1 Wzz/FepE/Etk N-terminal domain-containing protein [Staphylococcus sp. NRL 16/872]